MEIFGRFKKAFSKQQQCSENKDLHVGDYVVLELNKTILSQLKQNNSTRYDPATIDKGTLKGIIKAIYVDDLGNQYAEIISVVEPGKHRDYPVYFHEITKILTSVH
jgi:hypothetical protein